MRLRRRIHHLIYCRWRVHWRRFRGARVQLHCCTCYLMDALERGQGHIDQLIDLLREASRVFQDRRHLVVCLPPFRVLSLRMNHPTAVLIDRCIISGVPGLDGAVLRLARGVGGVGGL